VKRVVDTVDKNTLKYQKTVDKKVKQDWKAVNSFDILLGLKTEDSRIRHCNY